MIRDPEILAINLWFFLLPATFLGIIILILIWRKLK